MSAFHEFFSQESICGWQLVKPSLKPDRATREAILGSSPGVWESEPFSFIFASKTVHVSNLFSRWKHLQSVLSQTNTSRPCTWVSWNWQRTKAPDVPPGKFFVLFRIVLSISIIGHSVSKTEIFLHQFLKVYHQIRFLSWYNSVSSSVLKFTEKLLSREIVVK